MSVIQFNCNTVAAPSPIPHVVLNECPCFPSFHTWVLFSLCTVKSNEIKQNKSSAAATWYKQISLMATIRLVRLLYYNGRYAGCDGWVGG